MSTSTQPVKSADRALAVLEHLSNVGPSSFTELLEALELPRSSASGLLSTLEAASWIERDERRRYVVGLRAWQVGRSYRGHDDIAGKAAPLMDALAQETGETVQLARLDGIENVYIGISLSPNPMRLSSSVGMRLPSHATGIGKVLLAELDEAERARRLGDAPLARLTERTIVDPDELLVLLNQVADQGYGIDDEEYVAGCRCVAVPLGTSALGVIAALSVTTPSYRTSEEWPERTLAALQRTAASLRAELGLAQG